HGLPRHPRRLPRRGRDHPGPLPHRVRRLRWGYAPSHEFSECDNCHIAANRRGLSCPPEKAPSQGVTQNHATFVASERLAPPGPRKAVEKKGATMNEILQSVPLSIRASQRDTQVLRIFISYASEDREIAFAVGEALKGALHD